LSRPCPNAAATRSTETSSTGSAFPSTPPTPFSAPTEKMRSNP
jgi:hypothetical protein